MSNKAKEIANEIKKVIVGKDEIIAKVLMAILSSGHILIEDVPGVGKTTLALSFSRALGLDYRRIQFTSDSMPSDIIGFSVFDREQNELQYKPGAVMTNLLLADEINRTSSRTQSALLEVMEEGQVTVDGITHPLPKPFVVIATQNPLGSAGTQMLPPSQMDRFMICLNMGYPDTNSQINILKERHSENPLDSVNTITSIEEIIEMQRDVRLIYISDVIYQYITTLAEATRNHELIQLGISPRGALAVCYMAKAFAYIFGRDFVTPEDVIRILPDVWTHRLVLNQKAKISDADGSIIVNDIIRSIEMPSVRKAGVK